jgi:hypothetical protein
MSQLSYSPEELLREHSYARPYQAAGHRLHGGLDERGRYVSPRTLVRWPAVRAWAEALRARGGDLLQADEQLLAGVRYPNAAQQRLLLQAGLGQTFWNTLTITGLIEARGRVLAEIQFPDFQEAVEEDVSSMAVGHLNRGLLVAHGLDEGGEPAKGIGGHDVMWFAARDLAFGATDFPMPAVPERIGRPDTGARLVPEIPARFEQTLLFLCNLLMIEFRAEIGFRFSQEVLRDPALFTARRAQAEQAAEMIDHIRQDEAIHVESLRLVLGELRTLHFRTADGGRLAGDRVVDPIWQTVVEWSTVHAPRLAREQEQSVYRRRILAHPDGERILKEFESLDRAA